jgi:hypothetical protein
MLVAAGAAQANHPLITEDTGVLGAGRWQLELHGERLRDRQPGATVRATEASAVIAYGAHERVDLQVELPYAHVTTDSAAGRSSVNGVRDLEVAMKWRFFARHGLSLLLKPLATLPTGRDSTGFGAGRASFGADFAAAIELGPFELIGHAGLRQNRNVQAEREPLRHRSGAVLWSVTDSLRLVLDVSRDTNPDAASATPIQEVVYGATYELTRDMDVGFGVKNGRSEPAADRTLLLGLKLRW